MACSSFGRLCCGISIYSRAARCKPVDASEAAFRSCLVTLNSHGLRISAEQRTWPDLTLPSPRRRRRLAPLTRSPSALRRPGLQVRAAMSIKCHHKRHPTLHWQAHSAGLSPGPSPSQRRAGGSTLLAAWNAHRHASAQLACQHEAGALCHRPPRGSGRRC
jgi:hypothetical protein